METIFYVTVQEEGNTNKEILMHHVTSEFTKADVEAIVSELWDLVGGNVD